MRERQGRLDEALQFYRKAVERQPNFPLAHFHIGRILANQKKYDEAISHFLKTLSPEDDSTPAYLYALAAAYARAGNKESALTYGRKARDAAASRGQTLLLRRIDRDLQALEQKP
jgi:tetratricopeptide (TPR) repeat protein